MNEGQPLGVKIGVVAKSLGVCEKTIRNWMRNHGLPGKKVGGALRFDLHEVGRWFNDWTN